MALRLPGLQMARTVGRARRQPPPGIKAAPCPRQPSGGAALARAWGYCRYCYRLVTVLVRKNSCFVLIPSTLRSRNVFYVMFLMAQGAHRGRPVAAAPCTPGLRPATSPLRGAFDLSLQASGRAEAASLQNTALSPHPCGLPRPSGNVSAMLRPPAPAVSAAPCSAAIHILGLDPVGRVRRQPPPGKITAQ